MSRIFIVVELGGIRIGIVFQLVVESKNLGRDAGDQNDTGLPPTVLS